MVLAPPCHPPRRRTALRATGAPERDGVSCEPESGGKRASGPERDRGAAVERREPGDKPSGVPETEVQPYGQYRRNDPAGCAKRTAAGVRRKLGHAPLALRYPPRAEVHTATFRDAPASRALSGGVLLSVRERNKVRRHPGEHTRVDPRTVLRALPHDAKNSPQGT